MKSEKLRTFKSNEFSPIWHDGQYATNAKFLFFVLSKILKVKVIKDLSTRVIGLYTNIYYLTIYVLERLKYGTNENDSVYTYPAC